MLRIPILLFSCMLQFVLNQRTDFDYSQHGSNWGCPQDTGHQSPIELKDSQRTQKSNTSYLFCDYKNATGTVNYLNTTIYIKADDNFGSVYTKILSGEAIPLKATEIRLRMHSEHKTPQGYFDLEVQIFHLDLFGSSFNYKMAIGLLFNVSSQSGAENSFIQSLIDAHTQNISVKIPIDLRQLIPLNMIDEFWFYLGSVTIPPCTDGKMNWIISRKPYSITQKQNDQLIDILRQNRTWVGNYRKIQNHNDTNVGYRNISQIIDVNQ